MTPTKPYLPHWSRKNKQGICVPRPVNSFTSNTSSNPQNPSPSFPCTTRCSYGGLPSCGPICTAGLEKTLATVSWPHGQRLISGRAGTGSQTTWSAGHSPAASLPCVPEQPVQHPTSLWPGMCPNVIWTRCFFTHNFLCSHLQTQKKQMTKKR